MVKLEGSPISLAQIEKPLMPLMVVIPPSILMVPPTRIPLLPGPLIFKVPSPEISRFQTTKIPFLQCSTPSSGPNPEMMFSP